MGRPHRIEGTVISGVGRGQGLEAPTANLAPTADMALPRLGIYVTQSTVDGGDTYRSVTSVGTNPTFESDGKIRIETLLFDFAGVCTVRTWRWIFWSAYGDQRTFPDADSLAAQIKRTRRVARGLSGISRGHDTEGRYARVVWTRSAPDGYCEQLVPVRDG